MGAVCTIITWNIVQRDAEVTGRDARLGLLRDPKFHANGVKRDVYTQTTLHHVSEVSLNLLASNAFILECIECDVCLCV